jgi:hypothetical protein
MNSEHDNAKPRLVFFQYRYDEKLPEFLLIHKRDHVRCLSEFFDVVVVDQDCDYQEICDTHEPDLVLFESGVNHTTCTRLKISNIRACAGVPRAGLHNADAFCNARSGFLSDMDHWGVETFFTITTTAAEHMPDLADHIFAWPNCIDPDVYRDYAAWKSVPVLFSGNTNSLYPWRHKITRLVSERYPSLICPHPGYNPSPGATQFLFGEQYARLINASVVVPACGTVAKDIVRKHFEIPGCRACLLTERSPALEAAGFVDMENCIFADETDVLDKLEHVFRNPDELRRITTSGYELTHSRHTRKHRDQVHQWYTLNRSLQPHQRIVQTNPFGRLAVVDRASEQRSGHVSGEGRHLILLRDGDAHLRRGRYGMAEAAYLECLGYMRWMPEPKFGIALCRLHRGDAAAAHWWLSQQIEFILGGYGALDPDPVEWAYYALSLLCLGKTGEAARAIQDFPSLRHVELDRMRTAIAAVTGTVDEVRVVDAKPRRSIHRLPDTSWDEWAAGIEAVLRACGRPQLVERLRRPNAAADLHRPLSKGPDPSQLRASDRRRDDFKRRFRRHNTGWAFKRVASGWLQKLESRIGYFLPYRFSGMKREEFFGAVRTHAAEQHLSRVLLVGPIHSGTAEALLAGIADARQTAAVFCIGDPTDRFKRFESAFGQRITCHRLESSRPEDAPREITRALNEIARERSIHDWDAIVLSGSVRENLPSGDEHLQHLLHRARLSVFEGTNNMTAYQNCERLLADPNYVLVATNPGLRNGYSIFRRTTHHGSADASGARSWPALCDAAVSFTSSSSNTRL